MGPRHAAIGILVVVLLALTGTASPPGSTLLLFTVAKKFDSRAWVHGEERFPLGAQVFVQDTAGRHLLVNGFEATADPTASFDGLRVLFAGKKKAGDLWQIYEAGIDGTDVRRVTSANEDCIRPLYLPTEQVAYARKVAARFVIEAVPLGGGATVQLTYWPANSLPTDILRDGRVLFESEFPAANATIPELYTVYSDGSGIEAYRCDHGHARWGGRQVGSGDIVFASERGLGRFTSALAHEVPLNVPRGEYTGDVAEASSGEWIVAWRTNAHEPFELKLWRTGGKSFRVLASGDSDFVQPVVVRERAKPNRHPSGLHDWGYANLLCLNAYTSKIKFADESIENVQLHTLDHAGADRVLGTAHVEKDGSFYLRTPVDQPLRIELFDRYGKLLHKEQGWFWLRRGEQRVCVGCHAGPETAPENVVPAVLLRSTIPADLTGSAESASKGAR